MENYTKFLLLMILFILLTPVFGTTAAYLLYGIAYTVYVTGYALVDLALGAASLWVFFRSLGLSFKYWHRVTKVE